MTIPTKQFLDLLVSQGLLTADLAQKYEIDSLQKNVPIDDYLLQYSNVPKTNILKNKAALLNIPWVLADNMPVAPQAITLIPESIARSYTLMPYELSEGDTSLKVAMIDPFDVQTISFLQKKQAKKYFRY